ncbi:MAG: hypothetical protein RL757_2494 [Bacteroidota bacterium]|jgi:hypothetical protein
MKLHQKNPIRILKKVVSRLFDAKIERIDDAQFPLHFPEALKEIYEIDAHFSKDCRYETIHFFCNLDRLVKFDKLNLTEKNFEFAHENQNNWACEATLKSTKVYFKNRVEPQKSHYLKENLPNFLTTFALQEIAYNLKKYVGLEAKNMDEIKHHFAKVQLLWSAHYLIYDEPFSYYLVDDDCLVMWAGMPIFATNNQEKFEYYKNILKHYEF